jgi:membrane-bound lytic murein transglycosylase F
MAERVGFEPTCRNYPTIRFRVGAVMTTSVPLRACCWSHPWNGDAKAGPCSRKPCGRGWYSSGTYCLEVRFTLTAKGAAALVAVGILSAGCAPHPSMLETIRARNELRVVTLNSPTSFYYGAQGMEGMEYQLARAFAYELGVRLTIYPVANERAMQAELEAGRADIAAAQITATPEWQRVGEPAKPYAQIEQIVVYRRDGTRPRSTLQLESARLAVRAGSPQEKQLEKLKRTVAPALQWVEAAPNNADPLADVDSGEARYALIDDREYSFAHHLYPNVLEGFTLPELRPVQWIVRRGAHDLVVAVDRYFLYMAQAGRLARLRLRETGDSRPFAYEESREFQAHVIERLPRYQAMFQAAAAKAGIDWRLLAAIGYQESKWNPSAQSGDGALGVMMLTADTASEMGIADRNNPEQNIGAGAQYFLQVRGKIPDRIPEPDRTWFALAAYNVGFGHLEDARVLTQSRGKNPDSWSDVRDQLPLLGEERWYVQAKRGYARGWEPVQFVDRVQRYLTLLEWQPGDGMAGAPVQTVDSSPEPGA